MGAMVGAMTTVRRAPIFGIGIAALVLPLTTIVSHTFGRSSYPLLLPAIKDDVLETNTVAGFGGTVIYLAYLVGVVIVTALAGRTEPMSILRAGLVLSVVGLALLGFARTVPMVFIGLFFASAGGAGIWITAPGLATEQVAPERRGFVIGFLTASVGLGTSLLALGTRIARSATGDEGLWRPVFTVEALVAALILAAVVVLVRANTTAATGSGISLVALRRLPHWKRITVAYVIFGGIGAGYAAFLAETMETDAGLSRSVVANVYIAMGFTSVIAAPLVGSLSDRIGRRSAKMGVMLALFVGSAAVAVGGRWVVIVSVLALGGMWASYPTLTATYVRDHLDAREFGSAYGTMTIFYGLAAIVAPAAAGVVADQLGGFAVPYLSVSALALIGTVVLWTIPATRPGSDPTAGVTTDGAAGTQPSGLHSGSSTSNPTG